MSTKYADRAFISINGAPLVDLESATLKQNQMFVSVTVFNYNKIYFGCARGE